MQWCERNLSVKKMGKKGKITIGMIESALRASGGHQSQAAAHLEIAGSSLHGRIKKSPKLQRVLKEIINETNDIAQMGLVKHIVEGNLGAQIFWLKCHAKDRGFVERQEITGRDGGPIEQAFSFNRELEAQILDRLRDDNRSALRQLNPPPKLVTNGNR